MNKEQFLASGLLEQHALGITTAEESQFVERYLESFPDIRKEYTAMRKALDQYASQYASQPPEALRSQIISAVDGEAANSQQSNDPVPGSGSIRLQQSGWVRYLSYIAIIALGAGLFFVDRQNNNLEQELQASKNQLTTCEEANKALRESSNLYAFLSHGATEQIRLSKISPSGDNLSALAYWNPKEEKAFFNPLQLPATPRGKQYQIWADVDGEMISVGLLEPDFKVGQLATINYIPDASSLNVTLEPAGGSEHPTIENLLVNGKI